MKERCTKFGPVVKHGFLLLEPVKSFAVEKATDEVLEFIAVDESLNMKNISGVRQPAGRILRWNSCERFNGVDLRLEDQVPVRHDGFRFINCRVRLCVELVFYGCRLRFIGYG